MPEGHSLRLGKGLSGPISKARTDGAAKHSGPMFPWPHFLNSNLQPGQIFVCGGNYTEYLKSRLLLETADI